MVFEISVQHKRVDYSHGGGFYFQADKKRVEPRSLQDTFILPERKEGQY
jgi:hypothetical protein